MTEPDEPVRDDHAELARRRALTEDAARPDAVERRHAGSGRTARENIEDLVDEGSFVEYGRFAIAAQRFRRDLAELIERTPADGLVAGTARYGLGAQAMVGGSLHEPLLTVAWPGAHLGPMGLEGAVRLGLRKELEQIADDDEREDRVRKATAAAQENAKALNAGRAVRDRRRHRSRRYPRPHRHDPRCGVFA
jgi:acetyl-CoA carboxylase carboxyltransferase component